MLLVQIVNAHLFDQEIKGSNLRTCETLVLLCAKKDQVQTFSEETLLLVPRHIALSLL